MASFNSSRADGKGGWGIGPGLLRLKAGMGLCAMLVSGFTMAAGLGPPIEQPDRDTVVFQLDAVPQAPARAFSERDSADLATRVRGHIAESRATGSPRPLGLAQGLLARVPEAQWSPELYLLRATVAQRLHQFEEAREDLKRVLTAEPDNRQAWLTLYTVAMVQGDRASATRACERFGELEPGLWAASCRQDLASYGDDPERAFDNLQAQFAGTHDATPAALDWALVTLADMATRLGHAEAGRYWAFSLQQDPDDLYRRVRYADYLLAQGRPGQVVPLTAGYEAMDTLAVLRAVALTRLGHPDRGALVADLDARFAEAQWRGEFLHQWEYARYLLDVKGEAADALAMARANWEKQRAYPDRELLVRAARAANDQDTLDALGASAASSQVQGTPELPIYVAR